MQKKKKKKKKKNLPWLFGADWKKIRLSGSLFGSLAKGLEIEKIYFS